MTIYPIDLDLQLAEDRLIDIFFFQWHTPLPVNEHNWEKIDPLLADEKCTILNNFREWLDRYFVVNTSPRPLFLVTPELSMPLRCNNIFDQMVQDLNRPTVIIAGLEYLQWHEYRDLVYDLPCMPERDTWFSNGQGNNIVNAAGIWIRDAKGELTKYIQPKLNPQDHEQAIPLYRGQHTLFFRSNNQASGPRLNFCVQICSDFSSSDSVRSLRQCIAERCIGTCLDLTFLIQCNPDQEAEQFKQAIQTYFEVPNGIASTQEGCLFFLNNASNKTGKCTKWGYSKVNFPYERWRYLQFSPPTYWIINDGPHNHQAIILRESGPGVYWLTYKPHYLVQRPAGSGQSLPFPDGQARFAYLEGTSIGHGTDADVFLPIPAVCHWLKGECEEGESEFQSELKDNKIDINILDISLRSYRSGVESWFRVIEHNDQLARNVINLYFESCKIDKYPAKETEPQEWCPDVSRAIKKMMEIYSLLYLGISEIAGRSINPEADRVYHALINNGIQVTFLWGRDALSPRHMLADYQTVNDTFGKGNLLSKTLLILINPLGTPDKKTVLSDHKRDKPDIAQEASTNLTSQHLQKGDVVNVEEEEQIMLLYDGDLFGEVYSATNKKDLIKRMLTRLKEVNIA